MSTRTSRMHLRGLGNVCSSAAYSQGQLTLIYTSVSQSWRNRPLDGDFERQGGEKNKGGDRGAKQHKGGENAQPLIDC